MEALQTEWKFYLGATVSDKVSGFVGVVIARTEYLNGCIRYMVQPPIDKDGKLPQSEGFDEVQLAMQAELSTPVTKSHKDGGPQPDTPRRSDPR